MEKHRHKPFLSGDWGKCPRDIKESRKQRGTFFGFLVFFRGGEGLQKPCTSLLNLTPEIVDGLFNGYQRNLPRKVYFVDEVESCKIRWALVDDKTTRH